MSAPAGQPQLFTGEDGVWSQIVNRTPGPTPRGALFLDRDGVIVGRETEPVLDLEIFG